MSEDSAGKSDDQSYKPHDDSGDLVPDAHCRVEAVCRNIEEHIGDPARVFHELGSAFVHVDVHVVAPTDDRPYYTLVTSGMSDLPMTVPNGYDNLAYAEVVMCLPQDWKLDVESMRDVRNSWPVDCLRHVARFPHQYKTWMGDGHTVTMTNPPTPFCEGVPFTSLLLSRPKTVSKKFWYLTDIDNKIINFYSLIPLFPHETEFKLKDGAKKLEALLERQKVTELVDISRKDVTVAPWWKFGMG